MVAHWELIMENGICNATDNAVGESYTDSIHQQTILFHLTPNQDYPKVVTPPLICTFDVKL